MGFRENMRSRVRVRRLGTEASNRVEPSPGPHRPGIMLPTHAAEAASDSLGNEDSKFGRSLSYFSEEDSSIYFGNLLRNHRDFVARYPEVVQDFLLAFEHRRALPGFPEYALGENALAAVLEAMFKDEPTERSLASARALPSGSKRYSNPANGHDIVADYMERSGGILSRIALIRPRVIVGFCRNLNRVREDVVRYVAALHIEYTSRRNDPPL